MPADQAGQLVADIEKDLRDAHLLGWVAELVTVVAWVVLNRRQRKTYRDEINRISQEKTVIQSDKLGNLVKSSKSR
jgi:hypothetical protein